MPTSEVSPLSPLEALIHERLTPSCVALPGLPLAVSVHALHHARSQPAKVRLTLYQTSKGEGRVLSAAQASQADGRVATLQRQGHGWQVLTEGHPPRRLLRLSESELDDLLRAAQPAAQAALRSWLAGLRGEHHDLRQDVSSAQLAEVVAQLIQQEPALLRVFHPQARETPGTLHWSEGNSCYVLLHHLPGRMFLALADTLHALTPYLQTVLALRALNQQNT